MQSDHPKLDAMRSFSYAQVKYGNVCRNTLKKWISEGKVPAPTRIGRNLFFRDSQIAQGVDALMAEGVIEDWSGQNDVNEPAPNKPVEVEQDGLASSETSEGEMQPPKSAPDQDGAGASFGDRAESDRSSVETPSTAPPVPNRDEAA